MPVSLTSEQAIALAPDDSSVKAARSLATPRPWSALGQNGRSIWGACQGSGKDPYLTQVDWEGPAFKCTCPSRKFPCKHGLALLLLLAEQPALFKENADPPEWVATWIATRQQKAEAKAAVKETPPQVDEAARAKRVEQRAERVSDGMDLVELWLRDLLQQGLASAPSRGFGFWDQQAARLVDAQAPGLARLVRDLGSIAVSGAGWQDRMTRAIGRLVLLIHASRRLDRLTPATQSDVRNAIGYSVSQAEVLATDPLPDFWLVAGQRTYQEERLRVQRTWLLGQKSGLAALVLEFAAGPTAGFKTNLLPGTVFEAGLCFFPSTTPLRALVKEIYQAPRPANSFHNAGTIARAYEQIGSRLAANPWIGTQPVVLQNVIPVPTSGASWLIVDESQTAAMPCAPDYSLLALSGGRPISLMGEWNGSYLRPLMALTAEGRFAPIRQWAATQ